MQRLTKEQKEAMTKGELKLYRLGWREDAEKTNNTCLVYSTAENSLSFDLENQKIAIDTEFSYKLLKAIVKRTKELGFSAKKGK